MPTTAPAGIPVVGYMGRAAFGSADLWSAGSAGGAGSASGAASGEFGAGTEALLHVHELGRCPRCVAAEAAHRLEDS